MFLKRKGFAWRKLLNQIVAQQLTELKKNAIFKNDLLIIG